MSEVTTLQPQIPALLRINDAAPGFVARSTAGQIALSDYRGRWLLFVSHPADFTPVCTSEFIALARATPQFEALGCDILALSVDSLYSHLAWLRDIDDRFGVEVAFPVAEDPSMVIARAYGMLDVSSPNSATVRASYIIDPDGIIRAIVWYPMAVGRSVGELLRLIAALQASDREDASTPEGWQPGEALVELAATTTREASEAHAAGKTWYFRERKA
jgi:peroxiredoxin (alkyl hydroperoxide reductase subunit C)